MSIFQIFGGILSKICPSLVFLTNDSETAIILFHCQAIAMHCFAPATTSSHFEFMTNLGWMNIGKDISFPLPGSPVRSCVYDTLAYFPDLLSPQTTEINQILPLHCSLLSAWVLLTVCLLLRVCIPQVISRVLLLSFFILAFFALIYDLQKQTSVILWNKDVRRWMKRTRPWRLQQERVLFPVSSSCEILCWNSGIRFLCWQNKTQMLNAEEKGRWEPFFFSTSSLRLGPQAHSHFSQSGQDKFGHSPSKIRSIDVKGSSLWFCPALLLAQLFCNTEHVVTLLGFIRK